MKAATPPPVAAQPQVAEAGAATTPASPQYTPPPAPQAAPAPQSNTPTMAEGGQTRANPFKEFFSDINIVDVTISAFIVAAVIYSIQYHKFMMMLEKSGYADLNSRVGKLESAMAKKQAEANAAGGGRVRKRQMVRL